MIQPLVSVIIPSFNRESLISFTLNSIIEQTHREWEAIIIDDGSNDKTCEIVESFIRKDQRFRLLRREREPKGASTCRNIGLDNATGEYIIFLDSDDLLVPFCLEQRVKVMNEHPEMDFAVFPMNYFNDKGVVKQVTRLQRRDNYLYSFLQHDLPWNITCPIWRKSFIDHHLKGFNENYPRLQDPEFSTRALLVKNVKYAVQVNAEADSHCRLHWAKSLDLSILLTGFKLYLEEFLTLIETRDDYFECKKNLRLGYIEAIRNFYSYYKPKTHIESITLVTAVNDFAKNHSLISRKTYLFTKLLIRTYKVHLYKSAKGRYIQKGIMKLIKISAK